MKKQRNATVVLRLFSIFFCGTLFLTGIIVAFAAWDEQQLVMDRKQFPSPEAMFHFYNDAGIFQYAKGSNSEAIISFRRALTYGLADQDMAVVHRNLANAYRASGDARAAIRHYKKALAQFTPASADHFALLGEIKIFENNIPAAIQAFKIALRIDADNLAANNSLGVIYLGTEGLGFQNLHKALRYNQRALELSSYSNFSMENLAQNYFALNDYDKALELYRELDDRHASNADIKFMNGIIRMLQFQDVGEGIAKLREAAELDPEYRKIYQRIVILQDSAEPVTNSILQDVDKLLLHTPTHFLVDKQQPSRLFSDEPQFVENPQCI